MKHRRSRPTLVSPEPLVGVLKRAGADRASPYTPAVSDAVWKAAVGARIAERARPVGLERGVLTVRAATSVWASELSLLSDALLERLQRQGVAVTSLRFRIGAVTPPEALPERRVSRKIPKAAPLPSELAHYMQSVGDDTLRSILEEAATANLAWQRYTRGKA